HDETRPTSSNPKRDAPTIIIRDTEEAQILSDFILERRSPQTFSDLFDGRYSPDFSVSRDLRRIGVVNQTTMLATETQAIADLLRKAMLEKYGEDNIAYHFADTRDTLCYATSENQRSVFGLIESGGDLAIIVGGYNSSNTSHLAELFSGKMPAYHIKDSSEIISRDTIRHLVQGKGVIETEGWLPKGKERISILLTAGASCPDVLVEDVIYRIAELFGVSFKVEDAIA
ncbi:MAG: 4-hydroxy-3-methylbut-2-enyl diphosphate reductase, partial [Candidatus Dadabacteria bacterium]